MSITEKLLNFSELVQKQQKEHLERSGLGCLANINNCKTKIKPGKKYTKIDVGSSGKFMVNNTTEEIFGIKAYGVVHLGKRYGTLDEINDWFWGSYYPFKQSLLTI